MATSPAGPFFSTWGPLDGPMRHRDCPGTIGVVTGQGPPRPIGEAHPVGWITDERGSITAFRLRIGGEFLPGRYACRRREFVPVK